MRQLTYQSSIEPCVPEDKFKYDGAEAIIQIKSSHSYNEPNDCDETEISTLENIEDIACSQMLILNENIILNPNNLLRRSSSTSSFDDSNQIT